MQWLQINIFAGTNFGDLAQVHDSDAIADITNDVQIVGDEQISKLEWVSKDNLEKYLQNSFPSVIDVLKAGFSA